MTWKILFFLTAAMLVTSIIAIIPALPAVLRYYEQAIRRRKEEQNVIHGEYLDRFAEQYGIKRKPFESDQKLRDRVADKIMRR